MSAEEFDSKGYLDMDLLRFTTAGSVDDGKSTLIGRLLYDSKSIFEDQLEAIERDSKRRGQDDVNLALLTDGLRAEREQGITIDVAYRYFATPKRKFIIADTPGHIQYTRNMVTGASTANLAIILIDARNGVIEQTYRHSYIASLLRIQHVVVCVNKMDLVDYDQDVYEKIKADYLQFSEQIDVRDIKFVPISALNGDNVVEKSDKTDWYQGETLMSILETVDIAKDYNFNDGRLPVQYVVRPYTDEYHDYRGYAGRIAGGVFKKGDTVKVLPSNKDSVVKKIELDGKELDEAYPPMSVTMLLEDDIDISRGDVIVKTDSEPQVGQEIEVMMCWMSEQPMPIRQKYFVKHATGDLRCMVTGIKYKVNVNTLEKTEGDSTLELNDIACVTLKLTKPIAYDVYKKNRTTGSLILIDEGTNNTVGVAMINE